MTFALTSPAFSNGQPIPRKYSCDGMNISPPLKWNSVPQDTQSFALITDDPDAPSGTWVHWVIYNIPLSSKELPEHVPNHAQLPDGSLQGMNSWPKLGYGGPCPPSGTHRYFFTLYALNCALAIPSGASKDTLLAKMKGHILEQAELMGTYRR